MGLFSKVNMNEYNDKLEKVLESKDFSSETKNLLLSMLYKVESSFSDYKNVKVLNVTKEEFIENLIRIIEKECDIIQTVTPKTEESRALEIDNKKCLIDLKHGKIIVYANEEDLLYAINEMNILCEQYKFNKNTKIIEDTESEYLNRALENLLIIGASSNKSEVIRDFNGWSWNLETKHMENIQYNLIYQNLVYLLGENIERKILTTNYDEKSEELEINSINLSNSNEEELKSQKEDEEIIYDNEYFKILEELFSKDYLKDRYEPILEKIKIILLANSAIENTKIGKIITAIYSEKCDSLSLINDKNKFIDNVTIEKKEINAKIKVIDTKLNSRELIKMEYEKRNSKLDNEDKIFSISHLSIILENERKELLERLQKLNRVIEPLEYIKEKARIEKEVEFYRNVIECFKKQKLENILIELQKDFLKCILIKVDHLETKQEFTNSIYKFRYYCLLPINEIQTIKDIPELQDEIEEVINLIIDKSINKLAILDVSNSISLCFNILKYIFYSKILDLQNVYLKIVKDKEEIVQSPNGKETISYITISLFDIKDAQEDYRQIVNNLNLLNIKINKKTPVFF